MVLGVSARRSCDICGFTRDRIRIIGVVCCNRTSSEVRGDQTPSFAANPRIHADLTGSAVLCMAAYGTIQRRNGAARDLERLDEVSLESLAELGGNRNWCSPHPRRNLPTWEVENSDTAP